MCACMHACMHACMYVCMSAHVHTARGTKEHLPLVIDRLWPKLGTVTTCHMLPKLFPEQDLALNGHLQLVVSPRDSHQHLPTKGGGTQTPEFHIGKTKGIFKTNPELT